MAANVHNPGIPRTPTTPAVAKFIGTCNPILLPKAFKKNSNIAPIINFTNTFPINRNGLYDAPIKSSNNIAITIIETMIIGSK